MADPFDQLKKAVDARYAATDPVIVWVQKIMDHDEVSDATKLALREAVSEGQDPLALDLALPADLMAEKPSKPEGIQTFSGSSTVSDFLGQ